MPTDAPVLISWIAWNNDYTPEGGVNPQGPTVTLHQHWYEPQGYTEHVLLSTAADPAADGGKSKRLVGTLRQLFDRSVDLRYLGVRDVIDLGELLEKVQPVLAGYRDRPVDVFISPGTPMMQVAWVQLYLQRAVPRLRLLQGREGRHQADGKPTYAYFSFEQSAELRALYVKAEEAREAKLSSHIFQAEALAPVYGRAHLIAKVPDRRISTLICGETGTGKENLARTLHEASATRSGKAFRAVNCAALPDELLSSTLFGARKGAYTDAKEDRQGFFEVCDGGTLFLDEIGDTSAAFQQALLRGLQEGEVTPLGATQPVTVDVKVVAATHRDLRAECRAGRFRWDLFYRLSATELQLPPLRDYPDADFYGLVDFLIARKAQHYQLSELVIPTAVRRALRRYDFPGNIRELNHLLDGWYIFCAGEGRPVSADDLPAHLTAAPAYASWNLQEAERAHVARAYAHFQQNKTRTAEALGVAVNTLKKYLREIGDPLTPPS